MYSCCLQFAGSSLSPSLVLCHFLSVWGKVEIRLKLLFTNTNSKQSKRQFYMVFLSISVNQSHSLHFSTMDRAAPTHSLPNLSLLISPFHSTYAHLLSCAAYNYYRDWNILLFLLKVETVWIYLSYLNAIMAMTSVLWSKKPYRLILHRHTYSLLLNLCVCVCVCVCVCGGGHTGVQAIVLSSKQIKQTN